MAENEQVVESKEPVAIIHPSQRDFSNTTDLTFGVQAENPEKAESSPESEVKDEVKEEVKPAEAVKTDVQAEEKVEEKPSSPWENPDNPYFAEVAKLKEQQKATRDWTTRVNKENAELKRTLEMINKKIDGTWTEEDEKAMAAPDVETVALTARAEGAILASKEAAYQMYGQDYVDKLVFADDAPFKSLLQNDTVFQIIAQSESPIVKGIQMLEMIEFENRFGKTPKDIVTNVIKELEPKIREKVTKEMQDNLIKKAELPKGIGGVQPTPAPDIAVKWGPEEQQAYLQRTRAGSGVGL